MSELQRWMQANILSPGLSAPDEIATHLSASAQLSAAQRLSIYQRGYFARLLSCMSGQFKALHHALGEELFADFVQIYLSEYPSQSPTLSDLGQHFSAYLEASRPDADLPADQREPWADFMVELADYEWQLFLKFDGPGPETLPTAHEGVPDDQLLLQPSLSLHRYRFTVAAYCDAVSRGLQPELPDQQPCRLALLRHNYRVGIFRLTPAQAFFIQALKAEASPQQALAQTAAQFGTPEAEARRYWQSWRTHWLQSGFFVTASPF